MDLVGSFRAVCSGPHASPHATQVLLHLQEAKVIPWASSLSLIYISILLDKAIRLNQYIYACNEGPP